MKPTSERMLKVATEQRIRTPAIWTILKDYAGEVKTLEALIDEQNKLLDVFRTKLDKLEQETIYQLKVDDEKLRGTVIDFIKSMKYPYIRAAKTTLQMCNFFDFWISSLEDALTQKETT